MNGQILKNWLASYTLMHEKICIPYDLWDVVNNCILITHKNSFSLGI